MPPKTVTCSVCQKEVTKASTLEVSPGVRACRVHDGVTDKADAKQIAAKEAEKKRQEAAKESRTGYGHEDFKNSDFLKEHREFQEWSQTHCWTCGAEGISMQQYMYNSLVAMKALELGGKFNFLTFQKDAFELMGRPTVISQVPFLAHTDRHIFRNVVKDRIKEILPLLGFMRICGECAKRYNILDRIEATLPHPTMELAPLLTPQEDGMVWFKIFEHTLSEGGCYYLNVHPETWQASLSKSTYGMYRMLEKFPTVEDAVHFISENHWYENPDQDED